MKTIEIYCNYGVLGAEKRNVYTFGGEHPHATCSDRMTVAIPDEWELYENQIGQTMVKSPWGWNYEIDEILQGNENPCFFAIDENMKGHRIYLKDAE